MSSASVVGGEIWTERKSWHVWTGVHRCTLSLCLKVRIPHPCPFRLKFWSQHRSTFLIVHTARRDTQTDTELFFSSNRNSCSYDATLLVRSSMFFKFQSFQCHCVTTVALNCYNIIRATEATNKLWNAKTQCINYHMTQITDVPRPSCFMSILLFVR